MQPATARRSQLGRLHAAHNSVRVPAYLMCHLRGTYRHVRASLAAEGLSPWAARRFARHATMAMHVVEWEKVQR